MKKIYSIFILFLFSENIQSQAYFKMLDKDTTVWQHFDCHLAVEYKSSSSTVNFYNYPVAALDTITINNQVYHKLYELSVPPINFSTKQLKGYMREDTVARKVYFRENAGSPEYLLYNFSLNAGDTTYLAFPNYSSYNGYYKVDSIVTKNERCGPRKHFFLRKPFAGNTSVNYVEYIESIGSTFHVMYIYNFANAFGGCIIGNTASCYHPWTYGLACKHDKNTKRYQSCTVFEAFQNSCMTPYDSCRYGNHCSGFKTRTIEANIYLYPNPASGKVNVKFEDRDAHSVAIEIYDLTGKLLMRKAQQQVTNEMEIILKDITSGYYILKAEIDDKKYVRSFTVD